MTCYELIYLQKVTFTIKHALISSDDKSKSKKIFTHYEKLLEDFSLNQGIVLEILKKQKPKDESSLEQINFQIRRVEERQKELLNLRLDGELDKGSFLERKNDFVRQIATLEEQRSELWKEEKLKTMLESLVKNKKELSYEDNSVYSCLKMLQKHGFLIWRYHPESNRATGLCRPLHNRSAMAPYICEKHYMIFEAFPKVFFNCNLSPLVLKERIQVRIIKVFCSKMCLISPLRRKLNEGL